MRDVTFSPKGQRFYDTRDSVCNVWEPDALVRPDVEDLDGDSSLAESFATIEPVILHDESSESQVSAFAVSPDDMHYCCGKEDGSVTIHEAIGGTKIRKVYGYGATSTVLLLAWCQNLVDIWFHAMTPAILSPNDWKQRAQGNGPSFQDLICEFATRFSNSCSVTMRNYY